MLKTHEEGTGGSQLTCKFTLLHMLNETNQFADTHIYKPLEHIGIFHMLL